MLERARHFTQALIRKFRTYYKDFYKRYTEYIENTTEMLEARRLKHNYFQIVKMGTNLGCLCD